MTLWILAFGALCGAGGYLILRGLFPARTALSQAVAAVHAQPVAAEIIIEDPDAGWAAAWGRPAVALLSRLGLPGASVRKDLATLGKSVDNHLAEQVTAVVAGLLLPPVLWAMLALAGMDFGVLAPLWLTVLLAGLGFITPILALRAEAARHRAEFRHALSAYLDLVVLSLAGGGGVEQAMTDAASLGHGPAFAELRHTLATARASRTPPWQALSALGQRLGIDELAQLAASIGLAGAEGARVRHSLTARAQAMRVRQLATMKAQAESATERMSLPIALFSIGFLLFLGYPAIQAVLQGL